MLFYWQEQLSHTLEVFEKKNSALKKPEKLYYIKSMANVFFLELLSKQQQLKWLKYHMECHYNSHHKVNQDPNGIFQGNGVMVMLIQV